MTIKDIKALNDALTLLSQMTAADLLRVRAVHKTISADVVKALMQPLEREVRRALTAEERRARKNEAQRAFRATPEGRAYANEASKKSVAAKKHAEAVKALVAERIAVQKEAKESNKEK